MSVSILSYNGTSTTEEMNQQLFWDAASGKSYTKEQAISLGMFSQYQKDGKTPCRSLESIMVLGSRVGGCFQHFALIIIMGVGVGGW